MGNEILTSAYTILSFFFIFLERFNIQAVHLRERKVSAKLSFNW